MARNIKFPPVLADQPATHRVTVVGSDFCQWSEYEAEIQDVFPWHANRRIVKDELIVQQQTGRAIDTIRFCDGITIQQQRKISDIWQEITNLGKRLVKGGCGLVSAGVAILLLILVMSCMLLLRACEPAREGDNTGTVTPTNPSEQMASPVANQASSEPEKTVAPSAQILKMTVLFSIFTSK